MANECKTKGCGTRPPAGEDLCQLCGLKKQLALQVGHNLKLEERIRDLTAERDDLAERIVNQGSDYPE